LERRSQRTSNLFEQEAQGRENHRRAERESRVAGEEFDGRHFVYSDTIQSGASSCVLFKVPMDGSHEPAHYARVFRETGAKGHERADLEEDGLSRF
jgi:hypothetical protein